MAGVPAAPRVLMASASSAFRRCGFGWPARRPFAPGRHCGLRLASRRQRRTGILHHLLWGVAAARSGDIAGGHGDEVGLLARRKATRGGFGSGFGGGAQCSGHPAGAEEVDLYGIVERRVEAHRGSGVHGDVDGAEGASPASSRPRPSWPTSPFTANTRRSHISSKVSPSRPPAAMGSSLNASRSRSKASFLRMSRFTRCSAPRVPAAPAARVRNRNRAQEAFDERSAEKAGRAGDGDSLAGQVLPDHATYLMITVLPLLSPNW